MNDKPKTPCIEIIDVQARRREERSFCLVCQGHNMTEEQFDRLLSMFKEAKPLDVSGLVAHIQKGGTR